MTAFSFSLFHSRVARRMLGLFVLCALVPTTILGWVSSYQVTEQLILQTSARLRQESKAQGMVIYNHLLSLKTDLDRTAGQLPSEGTVTQDITIAASGKELGHRFRELRLRAYGNPNRHQLQDLQLSHLRAGRTLLRFQAIPGQPPDIVMIRAVNPNRWDAGLLFAHIDETLLWSAQAKETLPSDTDLLVEDHARRTLYSTFSGQIDLPDLHRHDLAEPMVEALVWQTGGQEYVAGVWTIPLRYMFLTDPWVIALSQSKESALAPIDQFRHTFFLIITSTLTVVVLLSLSQIRRQLQPVTLLREGTARLAGGDFTSRVSVNSHDEFEDLATSFNNMTGTLSRQFHLLETLSAISQAILSSHEPQAMMKIIQARISETIVCDAVGLILIDSDQRNPSIISVRYLDTLSDHELTKSACEFSHDDLALLQAHPHHLLVGSSALPGYLGPMARPALSTFAIFPILVNHHVSGTLVLAYRAGSKPSPDDVAYARSLADQVAVALTNSRAIESRIRAQMELAGAVEAKHQAEERADVLQAANRSLETKEERLRHQQSATLTLVKDRMVYEGSLEEKARQITAIAAEALAVERASIWIFAVPTRALYCLDSYERSVDRHTPGFKISEVQHPKYFEALRREEVLAAHRAMDDAHFTELTTHILEPRLVTSRLDAPFQSDGELAGIVSIEHSGAPREWAPDERQFVQALANFMTLVLEATHRRESEEALAIAKTAAEEATKTKAEFLANMSHEIRTPMNGVIGMTEILARTPLSETQRHYVETIHNSGDTLLTLINDILDFSKIEAGKLQIETTAFDLRELVERTAEQMAERAQRKGLQLVVRYEPSVPIAVIGDPTRIRQVLTNLLGNAVKFTQQGDVTLAVTTDQPLSGDTGPSLITFAVTDTGPGISPEGQARLFQSFSQVDGSSTRVHGGTGLGLSICKQLSELMGGNIGVQSRIGRGSTFWVALPLPLQAEVETMSAPRPALAGLRICAAVSHPSTQQLLASYLSNWGITLRMAGTGAEFLEQVMNELAIEGGRVIALIDETVTDMTDVQLLQALASDSVFSSVGTLRLVSFIRRAEVEQDPLFGRIPFVTKPLRYEALYLALQSLLDNRQAVLPPSHFSPAQTPLVTGHVLVAEDNPVNQEIALLMLESLGCTATIVQTGRDVLTTVQSQQYDLILMDCQMPDMDGFEATRRIREWESVIGNSSAHHPIPIIALTAHATPGDREHCLAVGMNDYLAKPFTRDRLQSMLLSWLPPGATAPSHDQTQSGHATPPLNTESRKESAFAIDRHAWDSITSLQRPDRPDMLAKILSLYLADSQQVVDSIQMGLASNEAHVVNAAAHSLKSRSAMLGATALAGLCGEIEEISCHGSLAPAEPLLEPLKAAFAEACVVFQSELDKRTR